MTYKKLSCIYIISIVHVDRQQSASTGTDRSVTSHICSGHITGGRNAMLTARFTDTGYLSTQLCESTVWLTILTSCCLQAPLAFWQHPLHGGRKSCDSGRHAVGGVCALICQEGQRKTKIINWRHIIIQRNISIHKANTTMSLTLKTESSGVHNKPMLLLLLVFGFCGMVGRAARAGFVPCGTALRRVAASGLVSPRGWVFSGEPGSNLKTEAVEDRFSEAAGLATDRGKKNRLFLLFFF